MRIQIIVLYLRSKKHKTMNDNNVIDLGVIFLQEGLTSKDAESWFLWMEKNEWQPNGQPIFNMMAYAKAAAKAIKKRKQTLTISQEENEAIKKRTRAWHIMPGTNCEIYGRMNGKGQIIGTLGREVNAVLGTYNLNDVFAPIQWHLNLIKKPFRN